MNPLSIPPSDRRGSIVALSVTNWHDDQWMNRHHICSRLAARGWRVVYSNGPLGLRQRASELWARSPWLDRIEQDGNLRIVHPGRLAARVERIPAMTRLAERRHASLLIRACGGVPDWVIIFDLALADYIHYFPHSRIAHHAYDYFRGYESWNEAGPALQSALVERANLITAASASIASDLPGSGPDRAIVMPNGANVPAFAAGENAPCPSDLAAIPRPRIIYAGKLNEKVDYSLIASCARHRPNHHWVLVGSVGSSHSDRSQVDQLRQLPNVHLLGERHHSMISAYVGHSDVVVLAYSIEGGWARFGSPLKLCEGLAAGKPVVSAPLDAVKPFAAVAALASTPDEWLDALDAAIAGRGVGSPEERRQVAREHDWEGWVDRYEALLLAPAKGRTQTAKIDNGLVSGPADASDIGAGGASSWRA